MSVFKKIFRLLFSYLTILFCFIAVLWSTFAIIIDGPQNIWAKLLAGFFLISQSLIIFLLPRKVSLSISIILFSTVLFWWLGIKPRNDRNWAADVAKLPSAQFNGDIVTINNLRNFNYKSETDFIENWENRTYDLSKVKSFDVFLSYWGPEWMAHAISSWELTDGRHLAISIETRKEVGEEYSAILGFFRQFELYYVVADEQDVIKLRTNFRKEQVYLYRLKGNPKLAKKLLIDYLNEINSLGNTPRWYNALTTNCSTVIREQVSHIMTPRTWHWKMLANGYLDNLAYNRGQIDTSLPFSELKRHSNINLRAENSKLNADFSADIRK